MGMEYKALLLFRRDVGPDKIAEIMLDLGQPLVGVHNNASNDQKRLVIWPRKTSLIYVYEPHKRFSFKLPLSGRVGLYYPLPSSMPSPEADIQRSSYDYLLI